MALNTAALILSFRSMLTMFATKSCENFKFYFILCYFMLYRAPVDTSPATEGITLFKYQFLFIIIIINSNISVIKVAQEYVKK